MKRRLFLSFLTAAGTAVLLLGQPGAASATSDSAKPAPAFTGLDSAGKSVSF